MARNATQDTGDSWFTTRTAYDIQGNVVAITDALGHPAFQYRFDLLKRRWRMDSTDAGRRDTVIDALGRPVESRDAKGALTLTGFDLLRRPTRAWARDRADDPVTLRQRIEYGDEGDRDQARARNLLGRPARHYDEAGLVTVTEVDFKGNVLQSSRQVIADAPILATYQAAPLDGWQVRPFQVDWTAAPGQSQSDHDAELLEPTGYATSTTFDALNRVTRHTLPADVEGRRRELHPTYNRAGALEQVRLDDTIYVERIVYNAKGQRTLIAYGNGVMTRYAYHLHTFRLTRLRSEPYTPLTTPDGPAYRPQGTVLQDYGYDYDLAGNILTIRDRTPGSGIPNNPQALLAADPRLRQLLGAGDALDRKFGYDPTYRLTSATGREHQTGPAADPWIDVPRGTDVTKAQAYKERYLYDAVGNLTQLVHDASNGFTRDFAMTPGSNRLREMRIGTTPYAYTSDDSGNIISETLSRHFEWNHADQLMAFGTQVTGSEPSVHAQYLYDAAGQRVKKLVRRQGGATEVTHYLNQVFEHHRWSGPAAGENNQIHVMDDQQRIALARVGPAHPDDRGPAIAYHLADHLASCTTTLDDTGALTNREEYTPYGETSFGSFSRKRYRFTGKERDEESGLAYFAARYYSPGLARWLTCDPALASPARSAFEYSASNPVCRVDPRGTDDRKPETTSGADLVPSYPIQPGMFNRLDREMQATTISIPLASGSITMQVGWEDVGIRTLNPGGLAAFLAEHVQGPLTPFEQDLVKNWGTGQTEPFFLTPIHHYPEGFVRYQLSSRGTSGETKVFNREGELLSKRPFGGHTISEGLGPLEYVPGAMALKEAGLWLLNRTIGKWLVKEAAAELGAEGEQVESEAIETATAPKPKDEPKILTDPPAEAPGGGGPFRNPPTNPPQRPANPPAGPQPDPDPWSRVEPGIDRIRKPAKK